MPNVGTLHKHSLSFMGPNVLAQNKLSISGLPVTKLKPAGLDTSPCDQLRICSALANDTLKLEISALVKGG